MYDTAVVLYSMPDLARNDAVDWLLNRQQPDGGWGDPNSPGLRLAPTLAAVLALANQGYPIDTALDFLNKNHQGLNRLDLDKSTVGVELVVPHLLNVAAGREVKLAADYYRGPLWEFGAKRKQKIQQLNPSCPSPILHTWETWGSIPDLSQQVDGIGSVGHSPAASVTWLSRGGTCHRVLDYLRSSTVLTGGHFPCNWPIPSFERAFCLWILVVLSDLHRDPALILELMRQILYLKDDVQADGIGMSRVFPPDGDDTAAAAAVLSTFEDYSLIPTLQAKHKGEFFLSYPLESHGSLTTTARAIHTLRRIEIDPPLETVQLVLRLQGSDGRWTEDKWQASWFYPHHHGIIALEPVQHRDPLLKAAHALLAHQHPDGGWGIQSSSQSETAYALHSLLQLHQQGLLPEQGKFALERGYHWLMAQDLDEVGSTRLWIGKDAYCPVRIDQMFVLTASLRCQQALGAGELALT